MSDSTDTFSDTLNRKDYSMKGRIYYKHLMHMTPNQLHNYLEGRANCTDEMKAGIKQVVKRQQEENANRRRSKYQVRKYWEPLINALNKEVKKVRACVTYTSKTGTAVPEYEAQRQHALATYQDTLLPLLDRFRAAKAEGLTPNRLLEALKEKGRTIPNDGAHWTDWVSPKKRLEVEVAFDAVPQAHRARRITPFALPRTTSPRTPNQTGRPKQPVSGGNPPNAKTGTAVPISSVPQPAQPTQPKE